jgi:hypothetical protein
MTSLYEDKHPKTSLKGTGFKDRQKAKETLQLIKDKPFSYQVQVVLTMYNRAKYHPHQTPEMRDAMEVFMKWLKKFVYSTKLHNK